MRNSALTIVLALTFEIIGGTVASAQDPPGTIICNMPSMVGTPEYNMYCRRNDTPDPAAAARAAQAAATARAISRYERVLRSSGSYLDLESWLAQLPTTEDQFVVDANHLHRYLRQQTRHFETGTLNSNVAYDFWSRELQFYTNRTAKLNALKAKRTQLRQELNDVSEQTKVPIRQATEINNRVNYFVQYVRHDQRLLFELFSVVLPPQDVLPHLDALLQRLHNLDPGYYTIPQSGPPPIYDSSSPQLMSYDAVRARPSTPILPEVLEDTPPLSGGVEGMASQLEQDAAAAENALDKQNSARSRAKDIEQRFDAASQGPDVAQEYNRIARQIVDGRKEIYSAKVLLNAARHEVQGARESFAFWATEAWIWGSAKTVAFQYLQLNVKRSILAKYAPSLNDNDIMAFYDRGEHNIFGLPTVAQQFETIRRFQDSYRTLAFHDVGYMQDAARIMAMPGGNADDLEANITSGMSADTDETIRRGVDVTDFPEPFKSVWTHIAKTMENRVNP